MSGEWLRRTLPAFAGAILMALGLVAALPAPQAEAALTDFVPRDQPSGQAAGELTDFGYLPDGGGILTTGKKGKLAWVAPDDRTRTLATLPVRTAGDLGLVGLAVAADYATSKHIYLARSVQNGSTFVLRLARWTVTGSPEPTGLTGEQVLFDLPGGTDVHGITGIVADDDGTLWVSIGDNADFNDNPDPAALRSLDPNTLYGKILHLTADGRGVPGNPYYDAANPGSARSRVFASGFRSPFRLSLDPNSGLPIVGDVGWRTWEEIDLVQPGRNYAWPCWEGNHPSPGYTNFAECANVPNTAPLWEYHHGEAIDQGNSVSGGIVYTGTSYPDKYQGAYFFGDYATSKLWTLRYDSTGKLTQAPQNPPLGTDIGGPVKFGAAPNGDIVYADIYSGSLRRLTYPQGNSAPVAKVTTSTDADTRTVTFDGRESVDYDGESLTYAWDFGDGSTTMGSTATHTYAAGAGQFTATLTVRDPQGSTDSAQVVVAPSNHSPTLNLTTLEDRTFAVNEQVELAATATDAEDGALTVTWDSTVLHCPEEATCHSHFGVGATGSTFALPFTDHQDSRMLLTATATDSVGVSVSETYVAWPRLHRLTLQSNLPASLQITNQDPDASGGNSALITEGLSMQVVASELATDGASKFTAWADGPTTRTRTVTIGATDLTLTANYATPIEQRYNGDAALRQNLGAPTAPEVLDGGVRYRVYERGRLYWSAQTGVHEIHGSILAKYLESGGHAKFGPPTTDESATPDGVGRYNHFIGTPGTLAASVYFSPNTGAYGVWGVIRERWAALNWELGPMGYPVTDELVTPDGVGRYNHFSKAASIYWTPSTGAQEVYGAIRQRWAALGWERSYLGYPRSGEFSYDGGRRNDFVYGYIQWYPNGTVIDRRW